MEDRNQKKEMLLQKLQVYTRENVMLAFSGGVDSSLLLFMACEQARKYGSKVYAVTLHTKLHPSGELDIAKKVAREAGADFKVLKIDELKEAGIQRNPEDRCYRCKKYLFLQVKKLADQLGISLVMEGTNEDDLHVYRPGIKAVSELGIVSPLADVGMTKEDVRALAGEYHISVSDKPSTPCLATRFPYGTELSYEALQRADHAENLLKTYGFYNVRVRIHGDTARIEVDQNSLRNVIEHREVIVSHLKQLGYSYITLDLEGFRSGSMDVHILSSDRTEYL